MLIHVKYCHVVKDDLHYADVHEYHFL